MTSQKVVDDMGLARGRMVVAGTVVVVLVAACGSTIDRAGPDLSTTIVGAADAADPAAADQGLDGPAPATPVDGLGQPGQGNAAPAGTSPGGRPGTGSADTTGDEGGTPADPSAPGWPPAAGLGVGSGTGVTDSSLRPASPGIQGVSDTTITVGLSYTVNGDAFAESLGGSGISQGDPRANYTALLDYQNQHGGVAGRTLEADYYAIDALSADSFDVREQAECEHYANDAAVYAVLVGLRQDTFLACLHQHPIALISAPAGSAADDATFAMFPRLVEVNALNLDGIGRTYAPGLDLTGYFEPEALDSATRIGLVTYDHPRFRGAVERSVIPALRGIGHDLLDVAYVTAPFSNSEIAATQAGIANAVLRFNSQGIDHVLFLETTTLLAFLFMNNAESQAYRPQYGLNGGSAAMVLADLVSADQLQDARSIGWMEVYDVPASDWSTWPGRQRCDDIYQAAGITFADINARAVGYSHCDMVFSFVAAVEATSGPLDADTVVHGLEVVGTGFSSALSGPTSFTQDKHHGVSHYRAMAYVPDCTCFRYTSEQLPVR